MKNVHADQSKQNMVMNWATTAGEVSIRRHGMGSAVVVAKWRPDWMWACSVRLIVLCCSGRLLARNPQATSQSRPMRPGPTKAARQPRAEAMSGAVSDIPPIVPKLSPTLTRAIPLPCSWCGSQAPNSAA